jgi:hypothetical protein
LRSIGWLAPGHGELLQETDPYHLANKIISSGIKRPCGSGNDNVASFRLSGQTVQSLRLETA